MARPRKKSAIAAAQVLTLRAHGVDWKRIERMTGVSRTTWHRRLQKIKDVAKPIMQHRANCAAAEKTILV